MKSVKIADVAAAAGVSVATASKALNGTDRVSKETVKRVQAVAKQLGYTPNLAARMLPCRCKTIGILTPDEPEPRIIYGQFHRGLAEAMEEYSCFGYRAEMMTYSREKDKESFPRCMHNLAERCNGLILIPSYHVDEYISCAAKLKIPTVSLQLASDNNICPCVMIDEWMIGRIAGEFLSIAAPGKETAVIAGDSGMPIHRRNIEGFRQEITGNGMTLAAVEDSFGDSTRTYELTGQLLKAHPNLGSIFVSTYTAPSVCTYLKEHGLAGQVKVVGVSVMMPRLIAFVTAPWQQHCIRISGCRRAGAWSFFWRSCRGSPIETV